MYFKILSVLCFLLAAGCAKSDRVKVHPVRGQIHYDGKPAAGVQVFLFPVAAPGVPEIPANPHGESKEDGSFTLTTYADGDGAAEGSYQLVLYWPNSQDEHAEDGEDRLLGWYTVARSKITVDVKPGTNDLQTFQLPLMKVAPALSGGIPGRN